METAIFVLSSSARSPLNSNMGCMETPQNVCDKLVTLSLNSNMGCMETMQDVLVLIQVH